MKPREKNTLNKLHDKVEPLLREEKFSELLSILTSALANNLGQLNTSQAAAKILEDELFEAHQHTHSLKEQREHLIQLHDDIDRLTFLTQREAFQISEPSRGK